MEFLNRLSLFFSKNWYWLSYVLIIVIAFSYFLLFQIYPSFADPDSFYHVKVSELILEDGVIKDFPWLQFTVLKDNYIDQHFLYHVFLIPFISLLGPVAGAKLANVMLTTAFTLIFYWFLRKNKIAYSFLFTILLLATTPLIFRLNLVKAPSLSLLILLLGLYCIFKKKYLGLFILSFIYVWAYGGFILMLLLVVFYSLVSLVYNWLKKKSVSRALDDGVKLIFSCSGGMLLGLVVNPYFPENLYFYWHQLIKIGIINYQNVIGVGNEWYPYGFIELLSGTALLSITLLVVIYFVITNLKKLSKESVVLFFIFLFFLIFTLKSRRYVEYYVPFAWLFCAFVLNYYLLQFRSREIFNKFIKFYFRRKILTTVLLVYFLATIPALIIRDVRDTKNDFKNGISVNRFKGASTWLLDNSKDGDIVFHSSWDEFPILFYHNTKNYYIVGLDPTFMYEYDRQLHKKMVDITVGRQGDNLYHDIKEVFNSSFIFVEKNHTGMNNNVKKVEKFREVYSDDEATIYKVLP